MSRERTKQLVDRLFDSKNNSSTSKNSKNYRDTIILSNSKERYVPSHQVVNSNKSRMKGE